MCSSFVFYLPEDGHVFGQNMKVIVYVNQFEYTYVHFVSTITTIYDTFLVTLTIYISFFFFHSFLPFYLSSCRWLRYQGLSQESWSVLYTRSTSNSMGPRGYRKPEGNSTISKQYPKWTLSDRQCWSVCYILNENYIT